MTEEEYQTKIKYYEEIYETKIKSLYKKLKIII